MKKILLLLLVLYSVKSTAQVAIYDAIRLKNLGIGNKIHVASGKICLSQNDSVYMILKQYVPQSAGGDKLNLETEFDANPFMFYCSNSLGGNVLSGSNLFPSSIGGLDVTNLADALAKFLVKRAKQELTIAYFDRFNTLLKKYPDLKSVFPDTYIALTLVSGQIYNYQGYLQTLRESFKKDLNAIYRNLPSIIDNHTQFFSDHPGLEAALKSGCYIAQGLKDDVHPGQILNGFHADYLDPLNPSLKGSIQTLQLFSASLRDTTFDDSGNYWVSSKQIKQLVNDKITFQIYMGLIYQQAKTFNIDSDNVHHTPIVFKDKTAGTITLNAILDSVAVNLNPVRDFITALSQKTEKLNNLIREHQKPASDSLLIEQYNTYFEASLDLLKHCTAITLIPVFKKKVKDDFREEMNQYFDVAQSTSTIVLDVARRNYSSAIVNAIHVYDLTVVTQLAQPDDSLKIKKEIVGGIFKYGSFMAAIVQATSSDDIENTIEAFALPQGSSRVKRESPFNVSLNGYAGLFYGHEYIQGIKDHLAFNSYGVTAPVGVSISRGHSIFFAGTGKNGWRDNKLGWSTSLFISIVDVGAIAAYRIKNDSIAQVPTIQLKNIFSPGAYLSIGIPKSPLSFNMGAQVGPNLRKVTDAKNDYSNKTFVRLSASLCIDIPVLNFYSSSH